MKNASGHITTENLVPAGAATAGSAVELPYLSDHAALAIQVTGTYTGALTLQGRADGQTWVDVAFITDVSTGTSTATIASGTEGLYRADISGFDSVRVSANEAVTGDAFVALRASMGQVSAGDVSVSLEASDIEIGAVEVKNATTDDRLSVSTAGQALVYSGGYSSSVAITRPDNTTAYTAGDVIGQADSGTPANAGDAILEFASIGPAGAHILITDWSLRVDLSAVPSGMTNFRLHLYNASPDAILDNAAWDLSSSGDRGKYLGYLEMGTPVDLGSTLFVQTQQQPKQIKLASGVSSVYGVLRTIGGYTPASQTVYTVALNATPL